MKSWRSYTVALIFLAVLNCNAQYTVLLKGQINPYDTAVATRVDQFRKEGIKFELGEKVIDSLKLELFFAIQANAHKDTLNRTLTKENTFLKGANARQANTIDDLNKNFVKLSESSKPLIRIEKGSGFWVGMIIGVIGTAILIK